MTFEGRVENGAIVLETPSTLPEGARVRIEVLARTEPTLFNRIGHLAGKAKNLPADAAEQHDHYLYGTSGQRRQTIQRSRRQGMVADRLHFVRSHVGAWGTGRT